MEWLPWVIIIGYFLIVSLISYIMAFVDKHRAIKDKQRIRERTLFIFAAMGGALAMLVSMKIYHHKTKHKRFMIGLPFIIIAHIAIIFGIWYLFLR